MNIEIDVFFGKLQIIFVFFFFSLFRLLKGCSLHSTEIYLYNKYLVVCMLQLSSWWYQWWNLSLKFLHSPPILSGEKKKASLDVV